jgi:hypothetical protein
MKMKNLIAIIVSLLSLQLVVGQGFEDALRYSQSFAGGTARSSAMGSAFGAVGADFGSVGINPAGIALYRSSELVFTPSFMNVTADADYFNTISNDFATNFNLNNFSFVSAYVSKRNSGWVSASFGIGYNRVNNFHGNQVIRGLNPDNSLVDYFMNFAGGTPPADLDPFFEQLAFDAFLMNYVEDPGGNFYDTGILLPVNQRRTLVTEGRNNEWNFTFGANYSNMLYLGGAFTINSVYYDRVSRHHEFDGQEVSPDFNSFTFTETLTTRGRGFSGKFGAIFRPVNMLRFGAAVHLPTYYNLEDEFYTSIASNYVNGTLYPVDENGNTYNVLLSDYKITTPFKAIGSMVVQFGKTGMISVDYDYLDYANNKINSGFESDFETNQEIKDALRSTGNLRVGGEVKAGPVALRAGYGFYGSPYQDSELNEAASYSKITGGIGVRGKEFFFDLGYVYTMHNEKYVLYFDNVADLSMTKHHFLATIGFRF